MTKRDVAQWAARNWWEIVVIIALPVLVWGAKQYDGTNVSRREWVRFQDSLYARYRLDSLHHVADDRGLQYLICRQDFTRRECLPDTRP